MKQDMLIQHHLLILVDLREYAELIENIEMTEF